MNVGSVWQNLASLDVRRPHSNGDLTTFSKIEGLFDQSRAEIRTKASTNHRRSLLGIPGLSLALRVLFGFHVMAGTANAVGSNPTLASFVFSLCVIFTACIPF